MKIDVPAKSSRTRPYVPEIFFIVFYLLKAGRFRSNGSTEIEKVRGRIFTDSVFPDFFARGRALCLRRFAKKFNSRKKKFKNS